MFSKFNFRRRRGALKTFNVVSLDGATLTYHLEVSCVCVCVCVCVLKLVVGAVWSKQTNNTRRS